MNGFGLIETIVALGIFLIVAVTGVSTILHSYSVNRLSDEESQAAFYTQECNEALKSIKNQDWNNLSVGTYGIDKSLSYWSLVGSPNLLASKFTRTLTISEAYRDGSNNLTTTPGTLDENALAISCEITWNFSPTRNNSISWDTFVTYWEKPITATCDWSSTSITATVNISSNNDAYDIAYSNNYAYVGTGTNGSAEEFYVIDVSNPSSPNIAGSAEIDNNVFEISLSGNYAYLATSDNDGELTVVDISNPVNPIVVANLDLGANQDALSVTVLNNYAYIGKAAGGGTNRELYVINISTPTLPGEVGNYEVDENVEDIFISGNQAYLATAGNNNELTIVDISTPASPNLTSTLDLGGNQDALSIYVQDNYAYIGKIAGGGSTREFYIVNVNDPNNPIQIAEYETDGNIYDLLNYDSNAFLSTNNSNQEIQIIDISNPNSPNLNSSIDLSDSAYGLDFNPVSCILYAASTDDSNEFQIIQPGANPTPSPTPTPSPITTCNEYCINLTTYSGGTCRQNTNQCNNNNETYESGGDTYCAGGPSADTCCCAP